MTSVAIAFYKGKDRIFNKLVSWWTRGPYSHTEFVTAGGLGQLSHCWSSSFTDGGIREKCIELDPKHWDIIKLDLSPEDVYEITKWFLQHRSAKYDVVGLIGFVFRRVADNKSRFFCSESIATAMGIKDAWRFDPNTLYALIKSLKDAKK